MKIVGSDNQARETVADDLLISCIPDTATNRAYAERFCDWLNTFTCVGDGGTFYRVREDSYVLSRGMEDLV